MRSFRSNALTSGKGLTVCAVIAILFVILPEAQARTSRHRKRSGFSVALQPFSLVHSVVRAVAAPIVHAAPRVAVAVAAMPIKVAYYAPRRLRPRPPRAEQVEYADEESASPIRAAYQAPSRRATAVPQEDEDYEQEQDAREESSPQIERRGDRPMVAGSRAVLRNGIAYAPARAPQSVKSAIWAANAIRRKPTFGAAGTDHFTTGDMIARARFRSRSMARAYWRRHCPQAI